MSFELIHCILELKFKFSLILFAYNLMIGYSKRMEKIIRESAFDNKKKKAGLKFNLGLVLTGVRTTGHSDGKLQKFQHA